MVAPVGVVVEGEIERFGDIDYWVFDGLPNSWYQIVVTPVTLDDPFLRVSGDDIVDAAHGEVGLPLVLSTVWSETLIITVESVDAASTGTYTLIVLVPLGTRQP